MNNLELVRESFPGFSVNHTSRDNIYVVEKFSQKLRNIAAVFVVFRANDTEESKLARIKVAKRTFEANYE